MIRQAHHQHSTLNAQLKGLYHLLPLPSAFRYFSASTGLLIYHSYRIRLRDNPQQANFVSSIFRYGKDSEHISAGTDEFSSFFFHRIPTLGLILSYESGFINIRFSKVFQTIIFAGLNGRHKVCTHATKNFVSGAPTFHKFFFTT